MPGPCQRVVHKTPSALWSCKCSRSKMSGEQSSSPAAKRRREEHPNTCAICLAPYRDPKFLPCHHTFCAPCIQDLADNRPGHRFPCPVCRKKTSLPAGGVASLQTNFYIEPKPGHQNMCKIHNEKEVELYCVQCGEVICIICKLTKHERHNTEDLTSAVSYKKTELQTDQQRLQRVLSHGTNRVTSLQGERQALGTKKAALERNIHNRYNVIMAAAIRKRDEVLRSLESLHTDLVSSVVRDIEQQEVHNAEVSNLLQQVNDALTSRTACDVITVAQEVRNGRGSQTALDAMTSPPDILVRRSVLQADVSTDVVTQTIEEYLGRVRKMEMQEREPDMRETARFQCAQDPDLEVFSLCHTDTDPTGVIVYYDRCEMKKDTPVKFFTEKGKCVMTSPNMGKTSLKCDAKGQCKQTLPQSDSFATFCKSHTAEHIMLYNSLTGQAIISRSTVTSTDPIKREHKFVLTMKVGPHRAFDVDDTGQYFAVLEEDTQSTPRRTVRLFRHSVQQAVATYVPPSEHCRPSDLCFYTLKGRTVLLVTDEANDTVHVLSVRPDSLRFERYLSVSSADLVQPTAITVDRKDRLWLACRGGIVLGLERID